VIGNQSTPDGYLAVVICDATAALHLPDADVERRVKVFPMPAGMAEYIAARTPSHGSVVIAISEGPLP
jgi:hypothetical protein